MKYLIAFYTLSIPILWVFYLAVMNLQQSRDNKTLPVLMLKPATLLLYVGLFWDILCNILVVTFIFLEFPRELTVSSRLTRLARKESGWKRNLARWFADNMLNPFCQEPHIKY